MSQGVPLKTISDLMGRASIEVTADIYLHSLDAHVRDTARMVENALGAASDSIDGTGFCRTCGQRPPSGKSGPDPIVRGWQSACRVCRSAFHRCTSRTALTASRETGRGAV
jgi:hypothetical protein